MARCLDSPDGGLLRSLLGSLCLGTSLLGLRHPGKSLEEYLRRAGLLSRFAMALPGQAQAALSKAAEERALPGVVGSAVGQVATAVVRAVRERRTTARVLAGCPRLADLLEAEADLEALSYYPHLLAYEVDRLPARHAVVPVVLLDTFEDVGDRTHRELERLVQRVVWLMPNALFIVTGRSRLQWADDALQGQLDRAGVPSFAALQGRMHRTRPAAVQAGATAAPALYVAFDLLHTGERSLLDEPYARRRDLLEPLEPKRPHLRVPPVWDSVTEAYGWTREHQLEGVVAKRLDSLYRPGARSRDWTKIKHLRAADVVIGGWLPGGPAGESVRAVLVGVPAAPDGRLLFVGSVSSGMVTAEKRALAAALRRLAVPVSPFTTGRGGLGLARGTEVRFVRPELHAEVEFLELTDSGRLRQPVWRGLRG